MIEDLLAFMPETILHAPAGEYDQYGQPIPGPATAYRARVVYRSRLVRNVNGDTVAARGSCWLANGPVVSVTDTITLPDGSTPPILAVDGLSDETGVRFVKVFFG